MNDRLTDRPTIIYPDPLPRILHTGTMNLLSGSSGIGKTALTAWLATSFNDGVPIFGHHPPGKVPVGYVTADRPWKSSQLWFTAVGFPTIPQYSIIDDPEFSPVKLRNKQLRVALLIELITKLNIPDGGVVFVDPLALFLGGNLNDYDMVSQCCIAIHKYLLQRQLCLVGLMHASKQKGDPKSRYLSVFEQMLGTSALLGYANTQMHLLGPDQSETGDYEFHWNPHHHKREMFRLKRRDTDGLFEMAEKDVTPEAEVPRQPIPTHCQALYSQFPDPPTYLTVPAVFALFPDASRPTVFRWLRTLVDLRYVDNFAHGLYRKTDLTAPPADPLDTHVPDATDDPE